SSSPSRRRCLRLRRSFDSSTRRSSATRSRSFAASSAPRPPGPRPSSRPERQAAGELAQRDNILGIDAKRALITIVVAIILVVGAVSLIGKAADFDESLEALENANRQWFPICLAGLVCAYAGYIAGYREIPRRDRGTQRPLCTV